MERKDIQSKWEILKPEGISGYKSLRITAVCIPDLFIGIDSNNLRCIILKLPTNYVVNFQSIIKENISLQSYSDTHWIVLKILNLYYIEIFDDLILSFYNSIKDISDVELYTTELIDSFHRWSDFFDESLIKRLSFEEVLGLFGELFILQKLISETPAIKLNDVIMSWTGPYGNTHDFCLDKHDLEIKTKEINKSYVHISSEFQLDSHNSNGLLLKIISVEINSEKSITMKKLVVDIRDLIVHRNGALHLFLKALRMKNLNLQNMHEYDDYRFEVKTEITYDCLSPGFPKLTRLNIPPEISGLSYNLNSKLATAFIIEINQY